MSTSNDTLSKSVQSLRSVVCKHAATMRGYEHITASAHWFFCLRWGNTEACVCDDELTFSLLEHKTISHVPVRHLRDPSIRAGEALLSHPGCSTERQPAPHCACTSPSYFSLEALQTEFTNGF